MIYTAISLVIGGAIFKVCSAQGRWKPHMLDNVKNVVRVGWIVNRHRQSDNRNMPIRADVSHYLGRWYICAAILSVPYCY